MKLIKPFGPRRFAGLKYTTIGDILYVTLFSLIMIGIAQETKVPSTNILSPLPAKASTFEVKQKLLPTETPTPTPDVDVSEDNEKIAEYIKEVFQEHSHKAFMVLSCENKSLNPSAVNTAGNSPAGSRDIGVFQINEYWQQTQGKFLFNYKVNIEIAYQLFTENGNSFKLWTCGKRLGI